MSRSSVLLMVLALMGSSGCGMAFGVGTQKVGSINDPVVPLELVHEPCDTQSAGAVHVDSDHDGKNDTVKVLADGKDFCHAIDTNGDGKPDAYVFFDGSGGVRRRESDSNHDGTIDEVSHFQNGLIVRKDRETGSDGKADTWEFYENGEMVRRLHDRDGNGKVDEWSWLHPKKGCATVHTDHDGDGKVDSKEERCAPAAGSSQPVQPGSPPKP